MVVARTRSASCSAAVLVAILVVVAGATACKSADTAAPSATTSGGRRTGPPGSAYVDPDPDSGNTIDSSGIVRPGVTGDPSKAASSQQAERSAADLRRCIDQGDGCWGTARQMRGVIDPGLPAPGKDLHGMDLSGATLTGANLAGANLSGAVLAGADLDGADLTGADLRNTNLAGTNLLGAKLDGAKLDGAGYCVTTMPDGSTKTGDCERLGVRTREEDEG